MKPESAIDPIPSIVYTNTKEANMKITYYDMSMPFIFHGKNKKCAIKNFSITFIYFFYQKYFIFKKYESFSFELSFKLQYQFFFMIQIFYQISFFNYSIDLKVYFFSSCNIKMYF